MKIHEREWKEEQSSNYESIEVWGEEGYRYRFRVKLDFYHRQSFAKAEVWSAPLMQWQVVHYIPGEAMKVTERNEYYKRPMHNWYRADLMELREVSEGVVEWKA